MAGLGVVVALAGAGTGAYLVAFRPDGPAHTAVLPQRVADIQSVGLVGPAPSSPSGSGLVQLLTSGAAPAFAAVRPSQTAAGTPEWTADQMAGGGYIFIYLPTGQCLTARGSAGRAALAVTHCNSASAQQRWRRQGSAVLTSGHDFYEFANASTGRCVTQLPSVSGSPGAAGLRPCDPARPAAQLLAFWWSSN
jgi:hypothetical protein